MFCIKNLISDNIQAIFGIEKKRFLYKILCNNPLNTWRNDNVVITSKQGYVKMTPFCRNNDVITT